MNTSWGADRILEVPLVRMSDDESQPYEVSAHPEDSCSRRPEPTLDLPTKVNSQGRPQISSELWLGSLRLMFSSRASRVLPRACCQARLLSESDLSRQLWSRPSRSTRNALKHTPTRSHVNCYTCMLKGVWKQIAELGKPRGGRGFS